MVVRLKITLEQSEYTGLMKLALAEMRSPGDQLRYIVRQELINMGLLVEKDHQEEIKTPLENSTIEKEKIEYDNKITSRK